MTQLIEGTGIRAVNMVTPVSRYATQNVIYYSEKKLITFDLYIRKPYVPSGNEKVMLITPGVQYRPDLVSYDVWKFPDNWWRILEANNMKDIWEFTAGKTIIIPDRII